VLLPGCTLLNPPAGVEEIGADTTEDIGATPEVVLIARGIADLAPWCVGDMRTRDGIEGETAGGCCIPGGGINPSYDVDKDMDGEE